jgi:hypothetical protein
VRVYETHKPLRHIVSCQRRRQWCTGKASEDDAAIAFWGELLSMNALIRLPRKKLKILEVLAVHDDQKKAYDQFSVRHGKKVFACFLQARRWRIGM